MRVQVAGRHMDVGEALRTRITDVLTEKIAQYINRATDAQVTVGRAPVGVDVDCVVHFSSGITLQAEGHGGDAHHAFDVALDKIVKRVRRYKRRLRNHHADNKSPLPAEDALAYVLAPPVEEGDDGDLDAAGAAPHDGGAERDTGGPLVIAETTAAVRTMPVAMAVMQLDLMEEPALLFRNAANGGLNMVYRRSDGNIGWVDPGRVGADRVLNGGRINGS
ncbi:MAG: ribosome-associated translation inhibitor RaiA [Hyphomonadaceae bacterium]|nr:ribosome-associated translation inhibitor RaiA [Hyphomonadaceae bacterium]